MGFLDKIFRPRMDKFLALLQEQAQSTVAGLELLEEFMRSDSNKNAKAVSKAEKAADEVRRTAPLSHPSIGKISMLSHVPLTTSWIMPIPQLMRWIF
jgi:hypothetical protein